MFGLTLVGVRLMDTEGVIPIRFESTDPKEQETLDALCQYFRDQQYGRCCYAIYLFAKSHENWNEHEKKMYWTYWFDLCTTCFTKSIQSLPTNEDQIYEFVQTPIQLANYCLGIFSRS